MKQVQEEAREYSFKEFYTKFIGTPEEAHSTWEGMKPDVPKQDVQDKFTPLADKASNYKKTQPEPRKLSPYHQSQAPKIPR